MKRKLKQPVRAEVLALWRARLLAVGRKLSADAAADDAWFWRIQFEILNYLLHRYAGDETKSLPISPEPIASAQAPETSKPAPLEVQPSGSFAVYSGAGKMPRVSREIRPLLENIVNGNRERHELLRQIRDELAEANRLQQARNHAIMLRCKTIYDQWHASLGEPGQMTPSLAENELYEALCTIVFVDSPADVPDRLADDHPTGDRIPPNPKA